MIIMNFSVCSWIRVFFCLWRLFVVWTFGFFCSTDKQIFLLNSGPFGDVRVVVSHWDNYQNSVTFIILIFNIDLLSSRQLQQSSGKIFNLYMTCLRVRFLLNAWSRDIVNISVVIYPHYKKKLLLCNIHEICKEKKWTNQS